MQYENANAEFNGLNRSFLEKNSTAQRILKESVTGLLRLASRAKKDEDSKTITEVNIDILYLFF